MSAPLLAVIGDVIEDVKAVLDHPPVFGTDNASTVTRRRGGSAANVAVAAARRVPTRFIGRVGDDRLGRSLVDELVTCGVEARVQTAGRTGSVIVIVTPDGERTMYPDRAAAAQLGPIEPSWLHGATAIHVPFYSFQDPGPACAITAVLDRAVSDGIAISFDASAASLLRQRGRSWFHSIVDRWRPRFVFANGDEADAVDLAHTDPPSTTTWVIKHGGQPAELRSAGGLLVEVPATPITGRFDSTGAGDMFAGTFLAAHLLGASAVHACESAHRETARHLQASLDSG